MKTVDLEDEDNLGKVSMELAAESKNFHDSYRKKNFVTPEAKEIDKLLSETFPYDINIGLFTSKDMIWDLPIKHANEISRQIIFSPKTGHFAYVILTVDEELESEQKIVNKSLSVRDVAKMIVDLKRGSKPKK